MSDGTLHRRAAREEVIDRYLTEAADVTITGKGEKPSPPPGLTEREYVKAMARRLGITEQWFRRRYLPEIRKKAARRETEIAHLRNMLGD